MLNPVRVLAEESVVQHQCTCAGVVHTASGWERNEVSMVTVSSTHRVTGERLLVSIHSRWSQWSPLPSFVEADNSVAIISVSYSLIDQICSRYTLHYIHVKRWIAIDPIIFRRADDLL